MAKRADQTDLDHTGGLTVDERRELVPDLLARRYTNDPRSYWQIVWNDFCLNRPAVVAVWVMVGMGLLGVLAPLISNHRPLLMYLPESAVDAMTLFESGWSLPLFAALRATDWVLLIGLIYFMSAVLIYRAARKRKRLPGMRGIGLLTLLAAVPLIAAPIVSPALHQAITGDLPAGETIGWLGKAGLWWALTIGFTALGGLVVLNALFVLLRNCSGQWGRGDDGAAIIQWCFGAILIVVGCARVATLGQVKIDVTDYIALADRPGVRAYFTPLKHNYLSSDYYMKHQGIGAPFTRVQPSGGSKAADDLGLTDTRAQVSVAEELDPASTSSTLTPDTRLADLRNGEGVRHHDAPKTDFVMIALSLERFRVMLHDTETIGDVIERIDKAGRGTITARISDNSQRLLLEDHSDPRPVHLLGTDSNGSDVLSRLIHATRVALSIGFVSTSIAVLIGVTVGALMGYFGGWVDIAGMRIIEIFMAIPRLFLLLTIIAFVPPEYNDYMLYAMMAVIGATTWMGAARFIRAEFFKLRDQDFVQAAKACGVPMRSLLFKHMLPNGVTPVLVHASFSIAVAILLETNLSFLGFGIKPPEPSWGQMLAGAVDPSTGRFYWWLAIFPGIMIFLTVFSFNLIGDALRDAIDPKLKKAAH